MAAVGADDRRGPDVVGGAVAVDDRRADDAASVVTVQAGETSAEAHLGTGRDGGLGQHPIEHGAARGVERRNPVLVGNGDLERVVAIDERGATDRRRVRRDNRRQHAPAVQLDDGPAHQRVGGQRVAAGEPRVDHQDPGALSGEAQRGGGTGATGADDEHVDGGRQRRRHAAAPW